MVSIRLAIGDDVVVPLYIRNTLSEALQTAMASSDGYINPPLSIVVGLDEDACRSDEELEEVLLEPPCIRCS